MARRRTPIPASAGGRLPGIAGFVLTLIGTVLITLMLYFLIVALG